MAMLLLLCIPGTLAIAMILLRLRDRRKIRTARRQLVEISRCSGRLFDPVLTKDLPEPARRYFSYTISPGTPLCTAVEVEMSGELGLGTRETPGYRKMLATELLAPPHGLLWQLQAGPISGSDGITPGTSWTRFWLFGLVPLVRAGGTADHHRAAFGRVVAEGVFWVPSSLLPGPDVVWEAIDEDSARAIVTCGGQHQAVEISIDRDGRPTRVVIQRWSNANPEKVFRYQPFGGYLSEFEDFDGYRLPTRVEGGNFIGTDEYFPFFKAEVTGIRPVI